MLTAKPLIFSWLIPLPQNNLIRLLSDHRPTYHIAHRFHGRLIIARISEHILSVGRRPDNFFLISFEIYLTSERVRNRVAIRAILDVIALWSPSIGAIVHVPGKKQSLFSNFGHLSDDCWLPITWVGKSLSEYKAIPPELHMQVEENSLVFRLSPRRRALHGQRHSIIGVGFITAPTFTNVPDACRSDASAGSGVICD